MAHYLLLHVTSGSGFTRVYFPLTSPDEGLRAARERWLDEQVKGRQRNVAKARGQFEAKIEDARLCHPTSWYREHELGAFAPKKVKTTSTRRRK